MENLESGRSCSPTPVPQCLRREMPHYWFSVVNWEASSSMDARHKMAEDLAKAMVRD